MLISLSLSRRFLDLTAALSFTGFSFFAAEVLRIFGSVLGFFTE